MTASMLGSMTVEHFDGTTGESVLISQVSITQFAQIIFSVLETNLEREFFKVEEDACPSPLQTSLVS